MAWRNIDFTMHERTGNVAWVFWQLFPWMDVKVISFSSFVTANNTCHNSLSIEATSEERCERFESQLRNNIGAFDTSGDPGERTTRVMPAIWQTVEIRVHLLDDEHALYNLFLITSLQGGAYKAKMRQFEVQRDTDRRSSTHRFVQARLLMVVDSEEDRKNLAGLVNEIHRVVCSKRSENSLALYQYRDDRMVSGFVSFSVEEIYEWLTPNDLRIDQVNEENAMVEVPVCAVPPDQPPFVTYVYRSEPYKMGEWDFPD